MRSILILLIIILSLPAPLFSSGGDISYNGNDNGNDIMLQSFHWESHEGGGDQKWYQIVKSIAPEIGQYFTVVWMPPPAESVAQEGYMPRRQYILDSQYGTQEQLRDVIGTLHNENVQVIADIVVNHRSADQQCNGKWAGFTNPAMTGSADFLVNQVPHDCGNGYPFATEGSWTYNQRSYSNDDFDGVGTPDLNHWAGHTRNEIKHWLVWLKDPNNAGFNGWRYDMIKGYDPAYIADYNVVSDPYLSVGEYWDYNIQPLADVVNRSGDQTMVFDFVLKNKMNDALKSKGHMYGGALGRAGENGSRGFIGWWSNAAITFVENHDTGFSRWDHPIPTPCNGDLISVKAAYALILTHPGIPSVYWYDWRDRGADLKFVIEELIRIRNW